MGPAIRGWVNNKDGLLRALALLKYEYSPSGAGVHVKQVPVHKNPHLRCNFCVGADIAPTGYFVQGNVDEH